MATTHSGDPDAMGDPAVSSGLLLKTGVFFLRHSTPLVRNLYSRARRGSNAFRLPPGKFHILLPSNPAYGAITTTADSDQACAAAVEQMFSELGYRRGDHWDVVRLGLADDVRDDIRTGNIISIGHPAVNTFTRSIFQNGSNPFTHLRFENNELLWRHSVFRPKPGTDFCILAVRPNPKDPKKKVVVIFGLSTFGCRAGGQVFAERSRKGERKRIEQAFGSVDGGLEVVLRVPYNPTSQDIGEPRVAGNGDGQSVRSGVHYTWSALRRIYESLDQHPRQYRVANVAHRITIHRDGAVTYEEEFDWLADETEVFVRGKEYFADAEVPDIEDIHFKAEVMRGGGKIVVVPAENAPLAKRFLLFPIPTIVPGDSEGRRVRLSARWPGGAQRLRQPGETDQQGVEISPHVKKAVDVVSISIHFDVPDAKFRVSELFPVPPTSRRDETYGISSPYNVRLNCVNAGTKLAFSLERVC